jgi:septum formation topological specificity factor MinE
MTTPIRKASDVKARLRDALATRKNADSSAARTRGKDLLSVLRKHAKQDLEALEAEFLSQHDLEPLIHKIEDVADSES